MTAVRLLLVVCSIVSGLSVGDARAADIAPGDCSPILPASEIEAGQKGIGWTVVQGGEPQPFNVTILGVQTGGIGPGRDLAIIEIADRSGSHFVADAGGIWAGMSGSPVYIDGKFAGAVSYTFSSGPSMIGGMTLAEDMIDVLSYGERSVEQATGTLTTESRSIVADQLGASIESVGTSFSPLPIPIVASSISATGLDQLKSSLDEQGLHGILVPGSAAAAPGVDTGFVRPVAGGNFAGVVSYGDVSVAGIGTTSYVCEDKALAFGHSFSLRGATTFGANDATSFAIVKDPTLGPFKLASIGSSFGLLDQDRITALGATLGARPNLIPITARLRSIALDRTRTGATSITMPEFVRSLATQHLRENILAVTDSASGGNAVMRWRFRGMRSNGQPFEVRRADRMTSRTDIGLTAAIALLLDLANVDENPFETVEFRSVEISGRINPNPRQDLIVGVEVSRNGGEFDQVESMEVARGDELKFRTTLRKPNGGRREVTTPLVVPDNASGSGVFLVIGGGELASLGCFSNGTCPDSFPEALEEMAKAPRADDVGVDLTLFSSGIVHYQARSRHRAVVVGRVEIDVTVAR